MAAENALNTAPALASAPPLNNDHVLDKAKLDAAVARANETFGKGHIDLTVRRGEVAVTDIRHNVAFGLASRDFAVAVADTNHDSRIDSRDTVVIASGGYVLTAHADGSNATISEAPEVANELSRAIMKGHSQFKGGEMMIYADKHAPQLTDLGELVSGIAKKYSAPEPGQTAANTNIVKR